MSIKILTKTPPCLCLMIMLLFPIAGLAQSDEVVPIPRKRPAVMSVSQAYIKQLMERDKGISQASEEPSNVTDMFSSDGDLDLENADYVPIPSVKPISNIANIELASLPNIEPAATEQVSTVDAEDTLVSFALQPGQLSLDENLKHFLNSRAVGLFKENQSLNMEVRAYSTAIDENEFSDVRLSLARALEVRKFLIEKNINASRIRIVPVGKTPESRSSDRIDLIFIENKTL